jgi:flagellar hook-basal body complex protein FliE
MGDAISGVSGIPAARLAGVQPNLIPVDNAPRGEVSFQDVLLKSLEQVNQLNQEAQGSIEAGLVGGDLTQVEIFTAVKKADLALRTMLQVRNKVLEAYNEIQQMRM